MGIINSHLPWIIMSARKLLLLWKLGNEKVNVIRNIELITIISSFSSRSDVDTLLVLCYLCYVDLSSSTQCIHRQSTGAVTKSLTALVTTGKGKGTLVS